MAKRPVHDIEKKWQERWEQDGVYRADDKGKAEKFYGLIEFPYPSGEGLHVGHPRSYTAIDVVTRKRRMEGKNVLYPIGWDAFGLPTENFAIKHKVKPQDATNKNVANFARQLKMLGFGFDWSREINTTDPAYYKWTQWQFLKFYESYYDDEKDCARPIDKLPIPRDVKKAGEAAIREYRDSHRMAYKAASTINWCPRCKIGLANEEAVGGVCERCGNPVEKREKAQWMIRITKYAERLLKDLDTVDYLDKIKAQQINWIGKSEGAYVDFAIAGAKAGDKITVFTTRPDTSFGATYLVLAPEHPLVETWMREGDIKNAEAVREYQELTAAKSDIERTTEGKQKSGVVLDGVRAVNPANSEEIPVWISDYVLASYGTGAIMAVPAHDQRDFDFATTFELPIKQVVMPSLVDANNPPREGLKEVFRNMILAVVHDPKTDTYLTLKWRDLPWTTFVTGGVDGDEDRVEAAKREIAEETGYTNVRLVRSLGLTEAFFYAAHKNENRKSHAEHFLFELLDENRAEVASEDKGKYEVQWLSLEELKKTRLQHAEGEMLIRKIENRDVAFTDNGVAIHSDFLDGLPTWKAKDDMISWLEEKGFGERATTYKLRDWVFSRQRYWGEPIPIVICKTCGFVPVPEKELPLTLPDVEAYEPTDTGESPLAAIRDWVEVRCPNCGEPAERETDTMPNWAGSSWYFLRYCDPHNDKALADPKKLKYWMPVDLYNGGMEHTVLHLLYSRFWYKFLWDLGIVPESCGSEPYARRRSHGLILAEGGEKMSKSKGNVVNPDDVVNEYGADVFRLYEMFMGPFDQPVPWDTNGIEGVRKFLDKAWALMSESVDVGASETLETVYHQSLKKITEGIEQMHFNTCVSQMMILTNAFQDAGGVPEQMREGFLKMLAPFAPHLTEELWSLMGREGSIHRSGWPAYDPMKLKASTFELVVQVNGKVRARVSVDSEITDDEAKKTAQEAAAKWLEGKTPKQVIYVKGKLVSIVV